MTGQVGFTEVQSPLLADLSGVCPNTLRSLRQALRMLYFIEYQGLYLCICTSGIRPVPLHLHWPSTAAAADIWDRQHFIPADQAGYQELRSTHIWIHEHT